MQSVSKWGNSLGVRLPAKMVRSMGLKEGDKVVLTQADDTTIEVSCEPQLTREEAIANIRALRWKLPEGYKFNRDEANSRYHD